MTIRINRRAGDALKIDGVGASAVCHLQHKIFGVSARSDSEVKRKNLNIVEVTHL